MYFDNNRLYIQNISQIYWMIFSQHWALLFNSSPKEPITAFDEMGLQNRSWLPIDVILLTALMLQSDVLKLTSTHALQAYGWVLQISGRVCVDMYREMPIRLLCININTALSPSVVVKSIETWQGTCDWRLLAICSPINSFIRFCCRISFGSELYGHVCE